MGAEKVLAPAITSGAGIPSGANQRLRSEVEVCCGNDGCNEGSRE